MTQDSWSDHSYWAIPLPDRAIGYCRLLQFPFAAFLDLRGTERSMELSELILARTLFATAIHESCLQGWQRLGTAEPVQPELPPETFVQDLADPRQCTIFDSRGIGRPATPEDCVDLEPAAVWGPGQVERRLLDALRKCSNPDLERLRVKLPPGGSAAQAPNDHPNRRSGGSDG